MGFWYKRTLLEKKFIFIIIFIILLSIGLMIALIVTNVKQNDEKNEICETPECLFAGAELQRSLNLSANPCEDFYEYACGGWMQNNIIGAERDRWSQFDVTRKRLLDQLNVLLVNENNAKYSEIIEQTIGVYKQCIDLNKRNSDGLKGLKALLNEIQWPMINNNNLVDYKWDNVFAKLNSEHGLNFILSNYVYLDAMNTKDYSIYIDAPNFGVGRAQLVDPDQEHNKDILEQYKQFILNSVTLLDEKSGNISPNIDNDVKDLIEFEKSLAKITLDSASRRNRTQLYGEKMTLGQFMNNSTFNFIPLLNIEKSVFNGQGINESSPLIVYDKQYFAQLVDVLKVPIKTIANYLGWRTTQALGRYTTKAFRDLEFQFSKSVSGVEEQKALWEECVDTVNGKLTFSVGKLYIDQRFSESAKQDLEDLIDLLDKAFDELLDDNNWMERETKDKARIKLNKMLRAIAYPDFIKDDEALKQYYKELNLKSDSYFESIKAINVWSTQKSLQKLFTSNTNRSELDWSTGPAIVNAFFSPNINRITFPAGILQSPFYTYGLPVALNLGAIGVVIGHEITHSFDDSGSQYDEQGNLHNWWDPITQTKFKERVNCFIDQYSGYNDSVTGLPIKGNTTIGENIADNGGLRQAFKALENYKGTKQLLPASMKSFTNQQLFYLSFANIWCTNIRKEALINQIETDPHSPGKYRVWGSVSNSESFAKAFNCDSNTQMNPKSKCILW